jgi:hypothetical protein
MMVRIASDRARAPNPGSFGNSRHTVVRTAAALDGL